MNIKNKRKNGFTLVELLVVIGVISVILAISIFGIGGARKGSRDTKRKADIETIRSAAELYRSDNDGYPASVTILVNDGYLGTEPTDPISTQSYDYIVDASSCDCSATRCPLDCLNLNPADSCLVNCSSYVVWASLENSSTPGTSCTDVVASNCGTGTTCNYCGVNP